MNANLTGTIPPKIRNSSLNTLYAELEAIAGSDVVSQVRRFFEVEIPLYLSEIHMTGMGINQKSSHRFRNDYYRTIAASSDRIIRQGETLLACIHEKVMKKKIKDVFRRHIKVVYETSRILKRALLKPNGYPGDYLMMEAIYDRNAMLSERRSYFDWYMLNNPYSESVRNRKDEMRKYLERMFLARRSTEKTYKILNLGCGSCREWSELHLSEKVWSKKVDLTCLDQDGDALAFAKQRLSKKPFFNSITFSPKTLLSFVRDQTWDSQLQSFHLIYSIGVADYLPDTFLKDVFARALELLRVDGILLVAHKDRKRYKPLSPDWFCDWTFIPRSKPEFINLLRAASGKRRIFFETFREPAGNIFFVEVRSKAGER